MYPFWVAGGSGFTGRLLLKVLLLFSKGSSILTFLEGLGGGEVPWGAEFDASGDVGDTALDVAPESLLLLV